MPDDIPPLAKRRRHEPRLATEAGLEFIMGKSGRGSARLAGARRGIAHAVAEGMSERMELLYHHLTGTSSAAASK